MEHIGVDHLGMALALAQADKAARQGDVPVGCAIVAADGLVIGLGCNERELTGDPTAHAEIVAIRHAAQSIGHWRLIDTTIYVTLEPCAMCAGAIVNARVTRVVWGADDPKWGAMMSQYAIGRDGKLNHSVTIESGLLAEQSVERLRRFFAARRRTKRD